MEIIRGGPPVTQYVDIASAVVAPRDEMKSEQGDDNDATCGRVGDLRIHSPHISTPPALLRLSLASLLLLCW